MELTMGQALLQAIEAQKAGKLQSAEGLYRAILQAQPKHPDANHNLGVLAVSINKTERALPLFKIALEANPNQGQFWISYVDALIKTNQLDIAKNVLEQGKKLGLSGERVDTLEAQLLRSPSQIEVKVLLEHYQTGRYDLAENLAKTIILEYPNHQFSWKVLGAVLKQTGRLQESLLAYKRAAYLSPNDADVHSDLGISLKELGRLEDSVACYKKAISIKPDHAEAHNNLGITLRELGRLEDSEACYKKAISIKPDYAAAHSNLGNILQQLGRLEEATTSYKKAIQIKPQYAEAYVNLGNTLKELGRLEDAETSYKKAIDVKPEYAEAYCNLGMVLKDLGSLVDAEACYKKAIEIKPEYSEAYSNLGVTLKELGKPKEALIKVIKSIKIKSTFEAKSLFMEMLKNADIENWDPPLAELVIAALLVPWGRPSDLMPFACKLIKGDQGFLIILNQLKDEASQSINDASFLNLTFKKEIASFSLLRAMLTSSHISDGEIEIFLTSLRSHFLKEATSMYLKEVEKKELLDLCCSLAQQCFINEYIYFQTPEENKCIDQLRKKLTEALENNQKIPLIWIIVTACYFPLHSVTGAEKLLKKKWPDNVKSVLIQQIQEPLEDLNLCTSIPTLSSIENQISLAVQNQYQENPYPRWVRLSKDSNKISLNSYICSKFSFSAFMRLNDDRNPAILIAGCGTGQHSIGTSQLIKGSRILAVDLSMKSLAYAKRKTTELGIENINYAQADLLKLASLSETFDVIESSGVLHHLENPFQGWEVLLSLLRPHGLMRLGFYSKLARRDIVRVRNLISSAGIGSSSEDIRGYRKHLLGLKNSKDYGFAISSTDFFSTSACRDLLFHVQEHRMNLHTLDRFFKDHDLTFLGFEIDSSVIQAYKKRFSNDESATNLDQWHIYEEENPDTFIGMYQFYVQKKS
jgi:tetratricopeptide (TPR) repeat protein